MIKIDHLKKSYEDFSLDISMEIPEGRVTGLIGRNGAGKSTTIKSILGLVRPDAGSVKVFGQEAAELGADEKSRMGIALAESGFSNYISVKSVAKIMKNMYADFDEKAFLKKAQQQNLPIDKQIKNFSTGMKARLRVLAALSHKADLLILDEPTAGLDVLARNEILDLLRDYMAEDERRSILITSHISSDLEGLCDDIYMIHDGRILLHEDTDVLMGEYAILKVSEEIYAKLDKEYILKTKKAAFGYTCLTNQKQYYLENYPEIVVENNSIDELILMMAER